MGFLQLGRLEQLKGEAMAVSAPKGCGRGLPQRNEAVSHPGSQRVSLAERGQKGHGREKELAWIVFKFLSRSIFKKKKTTRHLFITQNRNVVLLA